MADRRGTLQNRVVPIKARVKRAPQPRATLPVFGQTPAPVERADAVRNRERILKAARRLLKKHGMSEICMNELAVEAGVGKGTLYRRFPDRAALVHALLDEETRLLQERALSGFGLDEKTPRVEQALALLGGIFDFIRDHGSLLCEAQSRGNKFSHPAYAWQRQLLAAHLREAMRRGELRPVDVTLTAELMLSSVTPELVRWLVSNAESPQVVREEILATWRRALSSR